MTQTVLAPVRPAVSNPDRHCPTPYPQNRRGYRVLAPEDVTRYKHDGFLKITGIASVSDVLNVRRIIDDIYTRHGRTCGAIDNLIDLAPEFYNTEVFQSCRAIAKQLLGRTTMYAVDGGLYKEPRGKHGTPWHQDGAFHGKYFPNNTLAFWIPLQDVTPENGCMQYIPLQKRQILLPHRPYYSNDYRSMMTDVADESRAVLCPVHIGDATVHGPLTLHFAFRNSSDSIRRTWLLTFRPWGKWGFLAPSRLLNRLSLIRNRVYHRMSH